jgi:chromosomal replication initiation ATPase DnaA
MRPTLDELKVAAMKHCRVSREEIEGEIRERRIVLARRCYAMAARERSYTLADIGASLGGRSPSTILRLVQSIMPEDLIRPTLPAQTTPERQG